MKTSLTVLGTGKLFWGFFLIPHVSIWSINERTQNNSEHPLINTKNASRPLSKEEMVDRQWILYSLLPLGALPLLITCFYLFCCLRRHRGRQKKLSNSTGRDTNLVDVPQFFKSEPTEVNITESSQTLHLETGIYDNDPWFRVRRESGVYFNLSLEENKQGIVYASLKHSVIGMNPRQATNVQEAPTEYATICVRS